MPEGLYNLYDDWCLLSLDAPFGGNPKMFFSEKKIIWWFCCFYITYTLYLFPVLLRRPTNICLIPCQEGSVPDPAGRGHWTSSLCCVKPRPWQSWGWVRRLILCEPSDLWLQTIRGIWQHTGNHLLCDIYIYFFKQFLYWCSSIIFESTGILIDKMVIILLATSFQNALIVLLYDIWIF